MSEIAHILVVLDPTSDQQPALDRAVWFARRSGASLELFICDYDQYLAGERLFDAESLARARRALIAKHLGSLREHARQLAKHNVDVTIDARWDHPLHEGIARKVLGSKPDVVFKDTHYHPLLSRSVFSNTDWSLIRCCPAPLWLVKPQPMSELPRIVAAVDPLNEHDKPAALDHRIVRMARELRSAVDGEVHLMHAYEIAPAVAVSADSMIMPISVPLRDVTDALKKQHKDAVFALAEQHGLAHDHVHVHEGATQSALVRLTGQLRADIVVIGAVARSGLRRLFLGSTAEQVLDRLPCDMLIIKPSESPDTERRAQPGLAEKTPSTTCAEAL
jgi:universal stress protein E